ncbi:MAG: hypothetical protein V3T28_04530, partial [Gemmatimonadales bacterium]
AVRLSLGASRSQLIGQLLLEACVLAALGGVAGLLVARWTLALIISLLPAEAATTFPRALDGVALMFTGALAIGLGRVAQSLLFELRNTDPLVLVGAVSALMLVALGAGAIPAWRA